MRLDITFQERHFDELRKLVIRDDGNEAAAYILCAENHIACDPWDHSSRRRLTSYEVVSIPPEDAISASSQHITWLTNSFVRLLKRAKEDGLVAGIVHIHPGGPNQFSDRDNLNERELARLARNRNGDGTSIISVLLTGSGEVRVRLWADLNTTIEADSVRIIGRRYNFYENSPLSCDNDIFNRQALAFGPELNARLRTLRIGIVGCGGTGSATAMLLARLGVGQLLLFDDDIVELTNLNRLHGARRKDVDAKRPKVEVIAHEINEMDIGVHALPMRGWITDSSFRDALKSCDLIFGCTDDHDGRLLLNRLAYFYLIPVIDMGLAIEPDLDKGIMRDLSGRVTVLIPGAPCLLCRGIVDPVTARDEDLKRRYPEEYDRRKKEAYVRGSGQLAPAVVTFTTATACLAVDEMLQGLTGFRGSEGWIWQRTRRFDLMQDRRPGAVQEPYCPICSETGYWGRADILPFLDRVG